MWFVVLVEKKIMPEIIVNALLTLDGVMGRLVTEGITDADGFLLGRKT